MKRVLLLFAFALSTFGCSTDSTESANSKALSPKVQGSETAKVNPASICPDGFTPHFEMEGHTNFFSRTSNCGQGFGFCFGYSTHITFDCVRLGRPAPRYDAATEHMTVIVEYIDPYNARVWVDSAAVASPRYVASDFNTMEIPNTTLTTGWVLQGGTYTKNVSGSYYYYDVPFL